MGTEHKFDYRWKLEATMQQLALKDATLNNFIMQQEQ